MCIHRIRDQVQVLTQMSIFICMWIPPQAWFRTSELEVQLLGPIIDLQQMQLLLPSVQPEDQDRHIRNPL